MALVEKFYTTASADEIKTNIKPYPIDCMLFVFSGMDNAVGRAAAIFQPQEGFT